MRGNDFVRRACLFFIIFKRWQFFCPFFFIFLLTKNNTRKKPKILNGSFNFAQSALKRVEKEA
jgi:hypothetical protein